jgi:methyl-accepting chemotaxis protein
MKLEEAIQAHSRWKVRLRSCIAGQEKLDPNEVAKDHVCPLGQWIHGDGAVHRSSPMFTSMQQEHARFHRAASEVARKAMGGDKNGAERMLGAGSEFEAASTKVAQSIMALIRELDSKKH